MVDYNTERRSVANNDFEKGFFKLMINVVYEKTMEDLRKIVDVRLVTNEINFLKFVKMHDIQLESSRSA